MAYARELGFTRIAIATNATKLRLHHFTDRILDAGLTRITISMHGHTAELEDKLTRVPGNFEKKVRGDPLPCHAQTPCGVPPGRPLREHRAQRLERTLICPKMMKFFYQTMGLDDLRVNFIRPEGDAEGDADLTPRYKDVMGVLLKAIILNEQHFKKVFTFGGIPYCVMPPALRNNQELLRRYMGEYRDLSTSCSIRSDGVTSSFRDRSRTRTAGCRGKEHYGPVRRSQ